MRGWRFLACIAAAVAIPVLPAGAVNQNVNATGSNTFDPANVTVVQGESVSWNNVSGLHNVHFDDGSFIEPAAPSSSTWSTSRTFVTAGTFRYYCEAHGGPNGVDMSGTVTVLPTGSTPPPPPPPVTDKSAPALKLSGKSTQRVLRQRGIRLVLRVNEAASVVARGRVSAGGSLVRTRGTKAELQANRNRRVRLKFSSKGLRSLRSAFARRSRLTARITLTATDKAGNRRTLRSKFSLRR